MPTTTINFSISSNGQNPVEVGETPKSVIVLMNVLDNWESD